MVTTTSSRQLLLVIFTCLTLPLIAGCIEPIRMQNSVMITAGNVSVHFGDLDEFGTENQLGVKAFMAGDTAKAYRVWKPLAEQGDAGAQNNLGHLYLGDPHGVVTQDFTEALKWYSKAAEQFHASAHFSVGMLHLIGLGVPSNETEAFKWIRKSAEQGYEYAQYYLGNAYALGQGDVIQQDKDEAIKWMEKAAIQGNLDARKYLKENR